MSIYHALRDKFRPATLGQAVATAMIPMGLPPLLLYGTDLAFLQGIPLALRLIGFALLWIGVSYLLLITVLKNTPFKTVAEGAAENAKHIEAVNRAREAARQAAGSAYLGIPAAEKIESPSRDARRSPNVPG